MGPETVMAKRVRAVKAASSLVASNPAAADDQVSAEAVADDQQAEAVVAHLAVAVDVQPMVVAVADPLRTTVVDLGAAQDDLTEPTLSEPLAD